MHADRSTQALPTGRWVAVWLLHSVTPENYVVGKVLDVHKHGVLLELTGEQVGTTHAATFWVPWENVGGTLIGTESQSFNDVLAAAREFARSGNKPVSQLSPAQVGR